MKKIVSLLLVSSLSISLFGCGKSQDNTASKSQIEATSKKEISSVPLEKFVDISDEKGNILYSIKVDSINLISEEERQESFQLKDMADFKQIIEVTYSFKNISSDEDIEVTSLNFKVADDLDMIGESFAQPMSQRPDPVPKGTNAQAKVYMGLKNESKNVKLLFYDNPFDQPLVKYEKEL